MPDTDSILELVAGTDLTPAQIALATGHSLPFTAGYLDGWQDSSEALQSLPMGMTVQDATDYRNGYMAGRGKWLNVTHHRRLEPGS